VNLVLDEVEGSLDRLVDANKLDHRLLRKPCLLERLVCHEPVNVACGRHVVHNGALSDDIHDVAGGAWDKRDALDPEVPEQDDGIKKRGRAHIKGKHEEEERIVLCTDMDDDDDDDVRKEIMNKSEKVKKKDEESKRNQWEGDHYAWTKIMSDTSGAEQSSHSEITCKITQHDLIEFRDKRLEVALRERLCLSLALFGNGGIFFKLFQ
jgi:hypothetical protein